MESNNSRCWLQNRAPKGDDKILRSVTFPLVGQGLKSGGESVVATLRSALWVSRFFDG